MLFSVTFCFDLKLWHLCNWQWADPSCADKCSFRPLETSWLFQAHAKSCSCKSDPLALRPCR